MDGRVFVYGSLLVRDVVVALLNRMPRCVPATVQNYTIGQVKDKSYPAATPADSGRVEGLILDGLSETELGLLDYFEEIDETSVETNEYKKVVVTAVIENNSIIQQTGVLLFTRAENWPEQTTKTIMYVWNRDPNHVTQKWSISSLINSRERDYDEFLRTARRCRRAYFKKLASTLVADDENTQFDNHGSASPNADANHTESEPTNQQHFITNCPIVITNPFVVPLGFIVYTVHTQTCTVLRRYSDFDQLFDQLSAFAQPPPLPKKQLFGKLDNVVVEERRLALELWLNEVVTHEVFSQSEPLFLFLTERFGPSGKGLISSRTWSASQIQTQDESNPCEAMMTFCDLKIREGSALYPISALQLTDKTVSVFRGPTEQHKWFPMPASCVLGALVLGNGVAVFFSVPRDGGSRAFRFILFDCHNSAQAGELCDRFLLLSRGVSLYAPHVQRTLAETQPRLFLVVNPAAGQKKALAILNHDVIPLLRAANAEYDVLVTKHTNHLRDYIGQCDGDDCGFGNYTGVWIIGGDGTVAEYYQGLHKRQDATKFLNVPVTIVPAGGGNAMALSGGIGDVHTAIHSGLRGMPSPLDLIRVQHRSFQSREEAGFENTIGVVAFSWGLMANLDTAPESRFSIGTLKGILSAEAVRARVHYLPHNDLVSPTESAFERDASGQLVFDESKGWLQLDGAFSLFVVSNMPYIGADCLMCAKADWSDGLLDFVYIDQSVTRGQLADVVRRLGSGSHLTECSFVKHQRIRAIYILPSVRVSLMGIDGESVPFGPVALEAWYRAGMFKCSPGVHAAVNRGRWHRASSLPPPTTQPAHPQNNTRSSVSEVPTSRSAVTKLTPSQTDHLNSQHDSANDFL